MNGDVPVLGQPELAKPIVLRTNEGKLIVVPQVFVAQLNLQILQEIAARCAVATVSEVLKAFEARGIIPPQPADEEKSDATEAVEPNPAENPGGVT